MSVKFEKLTPEELIANCRLIADYVDGTKYKLNGNLLEKTDEDYKNLIEFLQHFGNEAERIIPGIDAEHPIVIELILKYDKIMDGLKNILAKRIFGGSITVKFVIKYIKSKFNVVQKKIKIARKPVVGACVISGTPINTGDIFRVCKVTSDHIFLHETIRSADLDKSKCNVCSSLLDDVIYVSEKESGSPVKAKSPTKDKKASPVKVKEKEIIVNVTNEVQKEIK